MDECSELIELHWKDQAEWLQSVFNNQEQHSNNMYRAYVDGLAWRLYRTMCHQRRGEDFPHPPHSLEGMKEWLKTLTCRA